MHNAKILKSLKQDKHMSVSETWTNHISMSHTFHLKV